MRISTAEIKLLIRKCVSRGGIYTTADFCEFINRESDKIYTRGQISGSIAQLIDLGYIERIDRGLYKEAGEVQRDKSEDENRNFKKNQQFKKEAITCLDEIEKKLEKFFDDQKISDLSNDEFDILKKMRDLKTASEKIRNGYV